MPVLFCAPTAELRHPGCTVRIPTPSVGLPRRTPWSLGIRCVWPCSVNEEPCHAYLFAPGIHRRRCSGDHHSNTNLSGTAVSRSGAGTAGERMTSADGMGNLMPFFCVGASLKSSLGPAYRCFPGGNAVTANGVGPATAAGVSFGYSTLTCGARSSRDRRSDPHRADVSGPAKPPSAAPEARIGICLVAVFPQAAVGASPC